jgi:DNA-binding transcriptional regulator/RsmH inhibitor MraZ
MKAKLEELVALAKAMPFTQDDREAQRRSFAYGNVKIENDQVTREMVDQEARQIAACSDQKEY